MASTPHPQVIIYTILTCPDCRALKALLGDGEIAAQAKARTGVRVAPITLLKFGNLVMVEGPFGSSYLREQHSGPILCVAGGSGLAPIKEIVEAATARSMKQLIHVYFGARSDRDLFLVHHFEGLPQRRPNLSFTPVLSDAPLGVCWHTGSVADAVAKGLPGFDGWKAYVAGPPPMVEAAMQICTVRGLRSEDLHADVFVTPG